MFALFYSLYMAMFTGVWNNYSFGDLFSPGTTNTRLKDSFSLLGQFATSIFGDTSFTELGNIFSEGKLLIVVSLVLALITSIGIVVMAVKGIKRVFGVFFMGIR